jgi:3-oxoacyl-[acyl-carrier protein] reductase
MLILLTGASRGIGFEIVKCFAGAPGTLVLAVSRNIGPLQKLVKSEKSHNILPLKADITDPDEVKMIVRTVRKLEMPLEILINNAGQIVNKPFAKISSIELESVYETNVFAPFRLIQELLPFMQAASSSHIVNISSMGGITGTAKFPGLSAYSSSKGALSVLSECLAEELKSTSVKVNCLALGAVQTEMLSRAFPGYEAPLKAHQMAEYICDFALNGHKYFNGKIIPVSSSTP